MIEFAIDKFDFKNAIITGYKYGHIESYRERILSEYVNLKKANKYVISKKLVSAMKDTNPDDGIFECEFTNRHVITKDLDTLFKENTYIFNIPDLETNLFIYGYKDIDHFKSYNKEEQGIEKCNEMASAFEAMGKRIKAGKAICDVAITVYPNGYIHPDSGDTNRFIITTLTVTKNNIGSKSVLGTETYTSLKEHEFLKSILLYIKSVNADIILGSSSSEYIGAVRQMRRFPPGHKKRKLASETIRALENTRILGSRITYITRHEHRDGESNAHGSPSPHWRRGHYRIQHFGKENSESKIIYIAPTGVCMPDFEKPKTYKVV